MVGDSEWTGGLYYSLNIVKLLRLDFNNLTPDIAVFCNSSTPNEIIEALKSLSVEIVNVNDHSLPYKAYGYIHRKISGKNIRLIKEINKRKIKALFPLTSYSIENTYYKTKCIHWLYDFQHKFLPQLFTKEEILKRDLEFSAVAENALDLVFSSNDSRSHFLRFYPNSKARLHVFKFVSLINRQEIENFELKKSYHHPFFIVSNQFWKHKNHMVVLQALSVLKERNIECKVLFTGNIKSYSTNEFFVELENFIKENDLSKQVVFTGFLPRNEQLSLMNNALAVIQPSFFEGWSTVVEDAKALNKYVLASNIAINNEQLTTNAAFFDPESPVELADQMGLVLNGSMNIESVDYSLDVRNAFNSIVDILYSK